MDRDKTTTIRQLTDTAQQHAARYAQADPRSVPVLGQLTDAGDAILEAAERYDSEAFGIMQDTALSPDGKQAARLERADDLRTDVTRALERIERAERSLAERAEFTPPQLEGDPVLAETKLQTARQDVRMMLDGIRDPAALAEAMRATVRQPPSSAVRHLLLYEGAWGEAYLRSRGVSDATISAWQEYRKLDAPQHLGPQHLAAWERREAHEREIPKAVHLLRSAAHFTLADRGASEQRQTPARRAEPVAGDADAAEMQRRQG